jgi:hypothetical protein
MPGIHFVVVRAMFALADLLNLIGVAPYETSGIECKGRVRSIIPMHQRAEVSLQI